jgi:hypothetical protein
MKMKKLKTTRNNKLSKVESENIKYYKKFNLNPEKITKWYNDEYSKQERKETYKNDYLMIRKNLRLGDKTNKSDNLKITKHSKPRKYNISSFDIETIGNGNYFFLFGFMNEKGEYYCEQDKLRAIRILQQRKNGYIFATNLGFDYNAIREGTDLIQYAKPMIRGGNHIEVKWKISNGSRHKVKLYDTMNYGGLSVESMGKMLGSPKLKKPRCLGRNPKNDKELNELIEYNKQDCNVTREFMIMFQDVVNSLGGELKRTLPACAMNIFRKGFLEYNVLQEKHFLPKNINYKELIYKAY